MCREVRLGVTVIWWVLVICLVVCMGRKYRILMKNEGSRGMGDRGLIPAPALCAEPPPSTVLATGDHSAQAAEVRSVVTRPRESNIRAGPLPEEEFMHGEARIVEMHILR